MKIESCSGNEIVISGNIKNFDDYTNIKSAVERLISGGTSSLSIKLTESLSMTSSVIGFLIKVINIDKISVRLYVKDERLYSLLDELNLLNLFNVSRIS